MQNGFEYKVTDHHILSKSEEIAIFKAYSQNKSSKFRNYIIEHNLKFAIHCANAYITKYPHVDAMDLRSYAILGLYEAIEKYDYNSGVKFISYAVWWVKATINKNVQSYESLVRYPANIHQNLQKSVNKKEFNETVVDIFNTISGGMSMDAKIKCGDGYRTLGDTIQDINALQQFNELDINDLHTKLFAVIDEHLSPREKYVVVEHFGLLSKDTRRLVEIGNELNISREHARNIKNKAFSKMLKLLKKWK